MKRRQLIAALAGVAAAPCVPAFAQATDADGPVQRPDVKVGDKWTEYRRPRLGAFHIKYERTAKVVGWERIVVPAGEFRALKIELSGYGRRLDRPGSQPAAARWRIWYAPEVKRPVKFEFQEGALHRGTVLASFSVG